MVVRDFLWCLVFFWALKRTFFARFSACLFLIEIGISSSNPGGNMAPEDNDDNEDDFFGLERGPYLLDIAIGEIDEFCIGLGVGF